MGPGGPGVPMSPLGPCRQSFSSRAQNVFIIVENTFLICVVTSFWIEGSLAGEDKLFRWRKRWSSRSSKATSVNKNLWLNRDWKRVFYGFQFLWAFFGSQVASWSEIYEFHLFFFFSRDLLDRYSRSFHSTVQVRRHCNTNENVSSISTLHLREDSLTTIQQFGIAWDSIIRKEWSRKPIWIFEFVYTHSHLEC